MAKKKIKQKSANEKIIEPKDLNKKQKKQIVWIFAVILIVFAALFTFWYFQQSSLKFKYIQLDWQKVNYNGINFYYSRFPITNNGQIESYYNLYLREDPRKNNALVDADLKFFPTIKIFIKDDAANCTGSGYGTKILVEFLMAAGYNIEEATDNLELAKEKNISIANFSTLEGKSLITIQASEAPSINEVEPGNYVIGVGKCDNVQAIEKFIIAFLEQNLN